MAIRSSSGFSHLRPEVFHIPLWTHKTQPRGWRKRKQTQTRVSSKRKKREVCDTFLAFCELSQACIRAKFPQSHQECRLILSHWPTWPLGPQILTVGFPWLLLTALTRWLPCSFNFSVLPPSLFPLGTFLPSSSSSLMGNLVHKPFVWASCQNRQRNLLTGTYPHPHNECPTSCHTVCKQILVLNNCYVFTKKKICGAFNKLPDFFCTGI